MTNHEPVTITDEIVSAICAELGVDPRTVIRRLAGLELRSKPTELAIDAALERHGVRAPAKGAK